MMKKLLVPALVSGILVCSSCKKNSGESDTTIFESIPVAVAIAPGTIDEASGIVDSKLNTGYLWVENDGNNTDDIFLLSYDGKIKKKIFLKNAPNKDWEDITIANGPVVGVNYIYLADIGDNFLRNSTSAFYRFPEPSFSTDTAYSPEKITFQYPDGPHDAEALLIDNVTKDIYVITKRDAKSRIYKLPYPQSTTHTTTATFISELPFNIVTSAATSPDGSEIVIKTYSQIYYWKRAAGETIEATLSKQYKTLGYQLELQGEAICFKNDNSGFFTLSEKPPSAASVNLNFYKRK